MPNRSIDMVNLQVQMPAIDIRTVMLGELSAFSNALSLARAQPAAFGSPYGVYPSYPSYPTSSYMQPSYGYASSFTPAPVAGSFSPVFPGSTSGYPVQGATVPSMSFDIPGVGRLQFERSPAYGAAPAAGYTPYLPSAPAPAVDIPGLGRLTLNGGGAAPYMQAPIVAGPTLDIPGVGRLQLNPGPAPLSGYAPGPAYGVGGSPFVPNIASGPSINIPGVGQLNLGGSSTGTSPGASGYGSPFTSPYTNPLLQNLMTPLPGSSNSPLAALLGNQTSSRAGSGYGGTGGVAGMTNMAGMGGMTGGATAAQPKPQEGVNGVVKLADTTKKYGAMGHNGVEHALNALGPRFVMPGQATNAKVIEGANSIDVNSGITAQPWIAELAAEKVRRDNPNVTPGSSEFQNKLATQLTNFNNWGNIKNEPNLRSIMARHGMTESMAKDSKFEHLYHSTTTPPPVDLTGRQGPDGKLPKGFEIKGNSFHQYNPNNYQILDKGNGKYEVSWLSDNNNKNNSHNNHSLFTGVINASSPEHAKQIAESMKGNIKAKTGDKDDRLDGSVARYFGWTPVADNESGGDVRIAAALKNVQAAAARPGMQGGGMAGHAGH